MTYKWLQALNLLSHAWLVRFCCCALLALPWACNGYGQTASWAVVVGIGSYQSTEIKSLQYAANDANAFAAFLASPQGQNLAPDNIVLLLDAQATLANIRSALGDHVAKRAKPGDKVFFYFAGHAGNEVDFLASGQADTAKYLLAFDSDVSRFYGTAFNLKEDLENLIRTRMAGVSVFCFFDCCHSGAAGAIDARVVNGRGILKVEDMQIPLPQITPIAAGFDAGTFVATACAPDELALETSQQRHGLFTFASLEALSGKGDADRDGVVTAQEYADYVKVNTNTLSNGSQHPSITIGAPGAQFPLSVPGSAPVTYIGSKPARVASWVDSANASPKPTQEQATNEIITDAEGIMQVKRKGEFVEIAVVSQPSRVTTVREALDSARQKQREFIRKSLGIGPEEAEAIYRKGKIIDAKELDDRTWFLAMEYHIAGI